MDTQNNEKRKTSGKKKALTFGAVLWDVIDGNEHIGGAPYNLAAHLNQLGFNSLLVSCVGNDERGFKIKGILESSSMNNAFIQEDTFNETGYILAEVDSRGIPSYDIPKSTAFDNINYTKELDRLLKDNHFNLFCFGSFDQRSQRNRDTLHHIWQNISADNIFFDVNLRKPFYSKDIIEESLKQANIVKFNDEERIVLSEMFYDGNTNEDFFYNSIAHDFNVETIIETKGKKGCAIWRNGNLSIVGIPDIESEQVVDTIGSGDAFCAGFLWSYCQGIDFRECGLNGNILGSFVAQSSGAVPGLNKELERHFGT